MMVRSPHVGHRGPLVRNLHSDTLGESKSTTYPSPVPDVISHTREEREGLCETRKGVVKGRRSGHRHGNHK